VIRLHRLGHPDEDYHLNPDLILSIEATPDTVVTLTTHTKLIVTEPTEQVVAAVRDWRSSVLAAALPPRPRRDVDGSTLVRAAAGEPAGEAVPREGR
jgi:flagellar protein FlbD